MAESDAEKPAASIARLIERFLTVSTPAGILAIRSARLSAHATRFSAGIAAFAQPQSTAVAPSIQLPGRKASSFARRAPVWLTQVGAMKPPPIGKVGSEIMASS